jgi:hypothetical protein
VARDSLLSGRVSRKTRNAVGRKIWTASIGLSLVVTFLWLLGLPVASMGGLLKRPTDQAVWVADVSGDAAALEGSERDAPPRARKVGRRSKMRPVAAALLLLGSERTIGAR